MKPNIQFEKPPFLLRECAKCHQSLGPENYLKVRSPFFPDGYTTLCADCIESILQEGEYNWEVVDKFCQFLDIPFVPSEFERVKAANGDKAFQLYSQVFLSSEYEGIGWGHYFEEFKKLEEAGYIIDELPRLREDRRRALKEKWGPNYDDEALFYLERLYEGLLTTQNVSGALQIDQALKICKISYELDCRIRSGEDFDKMLASYDKLVKTAEFTPKNVKNANDFDSVGELVKWLEKRGWKNEFYDGATRDVVDETIKNIQNYNQRLYTNESGIGDEITRRIQALKTVEEMENYYDTKPEFDMDEFDNEGWESLMDESNDEFRVEV